MSSHVNGVARLLQAVVGVNVSASVVEFFILLLEVASHATKARCRSAVNLLLVHLLKRCCRVAEDLSTFVQLVALGLRESLVEHVLIVLDDRLVATVLVIESVLRV